ncbi:MAG TPA: type II toxin-antitoxin system prevent-host-death family antitoxin [Gemmatimonadetes bacterium]|nr:type II toxin-antitoxin system prevent-host-death family antitoxin [Gemmatimonadota bacterium]
MATVSVSILKSRLSEFLRRVRAGDTLVVTDRGAPVAIVTPIPEGDHEGAIDVLIERGLVRPPRAVLPDDFWDRPRPKDPSGLCSAAALEERGEGW